MSIGGIKRIHGIIIPFLNEHPLHGAKQLDYEKFVEKANLQKAKTHLTQDGVKRIREIKATMNKYGRTDLPTSDEVVIPPMK